MRNKLRENYLKSNIKMFDLTVLSECGKCPCIFWGINCWHDKVSPHSRPLDDDPSIPNTHHLALVFVMNKILKDSETRIFQPFFSAFFISLFLYVLCQYRIITELPLIRINLFMTWLGTGYCLGSHSYKIWSKFIPCRQIDDHFL